MSVLLGLWLMAAPAVLGYGDPAADADRVAGPIAASLAFVALWDVVRGLHRLNGLVGAWLLVAPWLLGYAVAAPTYNSLGVGLLLLASALAPGGQTSRYGGGWSSLLPGRQPPPEAAA
jgi:hypothetical protein